MILLKKKEVFQELATTLFLMKELMTHPGAPSFMPRLIEQANAALASAQPYSVLLGNKQIREFFEVKPLKLNIDCGTDIIKGDTIRFVETIIDNRRKPPRILGKRAVTAYVVDVKPPDENPILLLRVIVCGGVWDLEPGKDISRTMRSIIQFEIKRTPWEDEAKRTALKNDAKALTKTDDKNQPEAIPGTPSTMLGRYDILRSS